MFCRFCGTTLPDDSTFCQVDFHIISGSPAGAERAFGANIRCTWWNRKVPVHALCGVESECRVH